MLKKLSFILLAVFLTFCNTSFPQKRVKEYKGPLIGKWETPNTGMDASFLTLEFLPHYKFSYNLRSVWNGTYNLTGTKLTSNYLVPFLNKWVKDTSIALINADTLVLATGKDSAQVVTKFIKIKDSTDAAGILGRWESNNFQGDKAIFTFQNNGRISIQKTLNAYSGNFIVQKNIFSVFTHRGLTMKMRFQIIRGNLYIYKIGKPGLIKLVRGK